MEGMDELVVMTIGGNKGGATDEATIHSRLLHANIMPPCQIEYKADGQLELSQLRSRGELKDYLKSQTTATYRAAVVQAAWEAAQGLAYIHKQGYIYRDFKPENILHGLLGSKDKPQSMLCDFGLTIHLDKAADAPVDGTSIYLPPEAKNSPAMDTWAFGVSLYELLSPEAHYPPQIRTENRRFTDRADIDQAMFAGWGQELDPTDAALRTLILQLLSKNPEERPTAQGIMEILFELVRH